MNVDAPAKPLHRSRTFWVNLLAGFAEVAAAVEGVLPPPVVPYIFAAHAVTNIILRLMTDQPVTVAGR